MFDRTLLRFAYSAPLALGLTIALSFAAGLLTIAQAWLLSILIARVFVSGETMSLVADLFPWLILVIFWRAAVLSVGEVTANRVAVRVKCTLRPLLFRRMLAAGPANLGKERTGELTVTLMEGVEALDGYFSQYLPQLAISALVPLAILLVVLPLDGPSALVLLLTAPLIPVFMMLIGNAAEAMTGRQLDLLGRLGAHFLDTLQGLATLKTLNATQGQGAAIRHVSERYAEVTLRVLRVAFLSALVLEMVGTMSTAIVAVEVGLRVLYGQMLFQPALFILILAPEFYVPLRMLGLRFHAAAAGAAAGQRILALLAQTPPLGADGASRLWHEAGTTDAARPTTGKGRLTTGKDPTDQLLNMGPFAAPDPARSVAVRRSFAGGNRPTFETISFSQVAYAYRDRVALRAATFELRAGKMTALFGPSGVGKSTLVNLLLRFIEPTAGEILVDGSPLQEWPAVRWREQIAWVPQTPHLLHDTLAANLRLARPDASLAQLDAAMEAAQLGSFLHSLPDGFQTFIGEGGARLSSGEAQRLALARAFLRNAPLLILDEPTSSVDPETEALLERASEPIISGRTVLVIAHRLTTIYRADQVVVLSEGRVVQIGSHQDLMRTEGLYRHEVGLAS